MVKELMRKQDWVMKPVVAFLRERGIRLIIYLDNMLVICNSQEELRENVLLIKDLFGVLGSTINGKRIHHAYGSATSSHMAIVREQCRSGGLSSTASQLVTASWRSKTSSYESLTAGVWNGIEIPLRSCSGHCKLPGGIVPTGLSVSFTKCL